MIDLLKQLLKMLLMLLPFILLCWANAGANLKRKIRYKQFLMPVFALIYCIVAMVLLQKVYRWARAILDNLADWIDQLALWLTARLPESAMEVPVWFHNLSDFIEEKFAQLNLGYWSFYLANALMLLAYLLVKKIILLPMRLLCKGKGGLFQAMAGILYEQDEKDGSWCLKNRFGQARTFLKTLYIAAVILGAAAVLLSSRWYLSQKLAAPFYPVFGIILVGELYFILNGLVKKELDSKLEGETDEAEKIVDYSVMRKVLRKLFPDKLAAENTTVSDSLAFLTSNGELLMELEDSDLAVEEAYGTFMQSKAESGLELDPNYLLSGRKLLAGESILFNDPFYYDLIPYVSYAMNRTLLRHKKVLIVLGRHGAEESVTQWCHDGIAAVTNIPNLWNVAALSEDSTNVDIGIVTRSKVHDLKLHEANRDFFDQVEFVVLIEPSRLLTTAQIGLNSLVRHCRRKEKQLVFCSADKNCDGLVDALSHVLMTSLQEVSATEHHKGASSYMIWEADSDHLQHRMLPNLSRYLGMGTELSFAALKHQVSSTEWYGGDAFPVVDINWIVRQYYYDLLTYAGLPASQTTIDRYFKVSPDLWSAKAAANHYLTVEDESFNMFEVKRDFATRATDQGFINVITSQYLLKDYMADNDSIFNADPKAIPYITADYARTNRNVVLRLCLRMSAGFVPQQEVRRELMLIDRDQGDPAECLWQELCSVLGYLGQVSTDLDGRSILCCHTPSGPVTFSDQVLVAKRRFSMDSGEMETMYTITDGRFIGLVLGALQPVEYIAEDENGQRQYLGTELQGQVFQKHLPGQFFTFSGKYYEMLRITSGGHVLVRRAADHINGRPFYRQQRRYILSGVTQSETMGQVRDLGNYRLVREFANIRVETPAYWDLKRYNDFESGRKITINGVPQRIYQNKSLLRLELFPGKPLDPRILRTMTLLINETLRTLLAENQDFLVAVCGGDIAIPLTCSLEGEEGFVPQENSIYLIEDSQMDIGLLDAVERNLDRIFRIICDYLHWHAEALDASMHPGYTPKAPDYTVPEEEQAEKKPGFFKRIAGWFKKIWQAIVNFFKKLFGKKKKPDPESADEPDVEIPEEPVEEPAEESAEEPVEEPAKESAEEPAEEDVGRPDPWPPESDPEPSSEEPSDDDEMTSMSLCSTSGEPEDTLEFEPDDAKKPVPTIQRLPYHERYYLRYGGKAMPEWLDVGGVLDMLEGFGCGDNFLYQARKGRDVAEMVQRTFVPNRSGSHYCDMCGCELMGMEYEVLADGRERCNNCGRTAVKSAEEFKAIHDTVLRNMKLFFGVKINAPVHVQMVNSKKLHRKLGKAFVPTGSFDGRVLGVAIKDRNGYSILVENGAPRLMSTMTMVHEMTHIWQYLNWNDKEILKTYGQELNLEIYEGMAKWVEVQYAYLIGEPAAAKREEMITRIRDDAYGKGFIKYAERYPLSTGPLNGAGTPFDQIKKPL